MIIYYCLHELFAPYGVPFSLKSLIFIYKVEEGKQINDHLV